MCLMCIHRRDYKKLKELSDTPVQSNILHGSKIKLNIKTITWTWYHGLTLSVCVCMSVCIFISIIKTTNISSKK